MGRVCVCSRSFVRSAPDFGVEFRCVITEFRRGWRGRAGGRETDEEWPFDMRLLMLNRRGGRVAVVVMQPDAAARGGRLM
jgi:hypothetical protein